MGSLKLHQGPELAQDLVHEHGDLLLGKLLPFALALALVALALALAVALVLLLGRLLLPFLLILLLVLLLLLLLLRLLLLRARGGAGRALAALAALRDPDGNDLCEGRVQQVSVLQRHGTELPHVPVDLLKVCQCRAPRVLPLEAGLRLGARVAGGAEDHRPDGPQLGPGLRTAPGYSSGQLLQLLLQAVRLAPRRAVHKEHEDHGGAQRLQAAHALGHVLAEIDRREAQLGQLLPVITRPPS
mmetsp:Transcript_62195/g.193052  ORF Transcript_62195/g.193052 Transcript_62195/m.193052 type:complete len:243 (-) Transcript_62195:707-1435(-)